MINKYHLGPCALGLLTILVWGCAAPVAPEDPNDGSSGSSGDGPNGGGGSSGSDPGSGGSGSRPERPVDDLPGVDDTLDVPPAGCLSAASATSVSLALDADVPSVLLAATGGTLHANGVECTSGGAGIAVNALTAVAVGGDGAQAGGVLLDLGSGDWAAFFAQPESVQLSFPSGDNTFVVRGSAGNDFIRHAMRDGALIVDLVGDGRINVVAEGVSVLAAQLAAGDDKIDDFSAPLIEQAAEAAAEAEGEEGAPPAEGEEGEEGAVVYAALSLPLVAEGGDGNDWLLGGSAGDQFDGGAGDDTFSGLGGEDAYFTSQMDGSDTFNGGAEFDAVSYEGRGADLEIHACASEVAIGCETGACSCSGSMSGEAGEEDRLINVEDITAGSGDDVIYGSEAADSLSGGPGDDDIFGLGGSDLLYGEGGVDSMDGGADGDYCANFGEEPATACEL
jgi:Ca2+-binding RTX toxin-like protein